MSLRHIYFWFCILGLLFPYFHFVPWVLEHGLNGSLLLQELFANRISAFFGMDVIISSIVVITFASSEGARLGMRNVWLPIVAVFLVGASLGLPLFLFLRQPYVERSEV